MAGTTKNGSIDQAIQDAVDNVVARILAMIEKQVNRGVDARISAETKNAAVGAQGRRGKAGRARARVDLTTWVADRRARRVPNFVIEMTNGLDTKKKVVAKYGENAKFERDKPLPQPHSKAHEAGGTEKHAAKAKPPTGRKAAAAS